MWPSVALNMKRNAVGEVVSRFPTANPRVFGSVLHGTDRDGSDLDLLVESLPGATLLDLGDLEDALKNLLGIDVDVRTSGDLPPKFGPRCSPRRSRYERESSMACAYTALAQHAQLQGPWLVRN